MAMIQLKQFMLNKQAELGRTIGPSELARETGINRQTIYCLLNRHVKRVDEKTIFALCKYFGIADGEPIPFLIYEANANKDIVFVTPEEFLKLDSQGED